MKDQFVTLHKQCISCHENFAVSVPAEGYVKWQKGDLIQDAMPEVSVADRELLISGVCGKCFDMMFPDSERED